MTDLPERIATVEELDEVLSRPWDETVEAIARLDGDVMVLGASGKVGPTLTRMALRAVERVGGGKTVYAVARSPLPELSALGAETIRCDLLDPHAVEELPRAANVLYLAGRKFGSTGEEHLTWALNAIAPWHVARTFCASRIVAFSTGCVYPLADPRQPLPTERTPPDPVGEYAMSCLARERVFEHVSRTAGLRVLLLRLNYAVELRYGVLVDVATKVLRGRPVDVTTGWANVIWQGDACNHALLSLAHAASPPAVLNVTGPETLAIRDLAERFGELLDREGHPAASDRRGDPGPILTGRENYRAYLSDASRAIELLGRPRVEPDRMVRWTADWIARGGESLEKPTHFEVQDGRY